jgi:metallophosphoesterase (TIGR00282 family)
MTIKILFFGDVVGKPGRMGLIKALPGLKKKYAPDLVIANAENLAHGVGMSKKTLDELVEAGVDAFTGGGHSWQNSQGTPLLDDPAWRERLVVPMNAGEAQNGRAWTMLEVKQKRILLVSIQGCLFTHPATQDPFAALDKIIEQQKGSKPNIIIVDFHAEATAEKEAFGHYADGRVAAVLGTHTHVATADLKILPGGTAYVTDVGRTGAYDSVMGFEKTSAINSFLHQKDRKYTLSNQGAMEINAVSLTLDPETGLTKNLDRIREIIDI